MSNNLFNILIREGVAFKFQYGESGPEKGGEVTLAPFKIDGVPFVVKMTRDFFMLFQENPLDD